MSLYRSTKGSVDLIVMAVLGGLFIAVSIPLLFEIGKRWGGQLTDVECGLVMGNTHNECNLPVHDDGGDKESDGEDK